MKQVFKADDGTEFATRAECKEHEGGLAFHILTGRNEKEIDAAVRRDPKYVDLSDALEKAGSIVSRKRCQDGDYRRKPRNSATAGAGSLANPHGSLRKGNT